MVKILQSTSVGILLFDPLTSLECRRGRHFYFPFTHKENEAQKYFIELPHGAEPGPRDRLSMFQPIVWHGSHWLQGNLSLESCFKERESSRIRTSLTKQACEVDSTQALCPGNLELLCNQQIINSSYNKINAEKRWKKKRKR